MTLFEKVKSNVTTLQAAERYGLKVKHGGTDGDFDSHESVGDPGDFQEIIQEHGNQKNDAEGWKDHSYRCRDCSNQALLLVTDEGCAIDGYWAGRGFRDHCDVHHLVVCDPAFLLDAGILNQRNHGISTAESEQSDLCKCQEQIKQYIHMSFPAVRPL